MTRICVVCGKPFETKLSRLMVCSDTCKRERERRRALIEYHADRPNSRTYGEKMQAPTETQHQIEKRNRMNMIKLLYMLKHLPKPEKVDLNMDMLRIAYIKIESMPLLIVGGDKREKAMYRVH